MQDAANGWISYLRSLSCPNHSPNIGALSENSLYARFGGNSRCSNLERSLQSSSNGTRQTNLTHVFDSDLKEVKRRRRVFTESDKRRIAAVRRRGACIECKAKKKKVRADDCISVRRSPDQDQCHHLLVEENESGATSPDLSAASSATCTEAPDGSPAQSILPSHQNSEPAMGHAISVPELIPPVSVSHSSQSRQLATSTPYVRPTHRKLVCPKCNIKPDGYRGEHELRRHMDRAHGRVQVRWKCVDISDDGKFLASCKACKSGKLYGAYYNAAAHLRRAHFEPKVRERRKSQLSKGTSEQAKGTPVPMETLKMWMQEVEVRHVMEEDEPDAETDTQDDGLEDEAHASHGCGIGTGLPRPAPFSTSQTRPQPALVERNDFNRKDLFTEHLRQRHGPSPYAPVLPVAPSTATSRTSDADAGPRSER